MCLKWKSSHTMSISISNRNFKVIFRYHKNETIVKCPLYGVWENIVCMWEIRSMCARSINSVYLLSEYRVGRERECVCTKNQISISKTRYNTQIVKSTHTISERYTESKTKKMKKTATTKTKLSERRTKYEWGRESSDGIWHRRRILWLIYK